MRKMLRGCFIGNINNSIPSGATCTAYSAAYSRVTNQVSSGITPTPTYDANGNQTTSTPALLTWNALAQPITVNSTTATYDALGRMVEKGLSGTYTQFVYRPDGSLMTLYSGAVVQTQFPLPGGATAVYNSSGLNYIRHTDWLGSSRFATTWNHTVYSKKAYAPFGETYNEAGTADRSFTGQDQDVVTGSAGTGVYDFLFRKYDPSAGRWLSPDPAGWQAVSPRHPQSLNRYAYVQNNPLSLIDPFRLDCVWENDDGKVSVSTGDCPDSGPGANGTYINCDGCVLNDGSATFDSNGDLNGYCTSGGCNDGNGNPVAADPDAPVFDAYGWYHPSDGQAFASSVPIATDLENFLLRPWSAGLLLPMDDDTPVGPAFTMSADLKKGFVCLGLGGGVGQRGLNGGPLWGDTENSRAILSGASVSTNLAGPIGFQRIENADGALYGPTVGNPGASLAVTYSWCKSF
jgi:RHS repeat-associated protein